MQNYIHCIFKRVWTNKTCIDKTLHFEITAQLQRWPVADIQRKDEMKQVWRLVVLISEKQKPERKGTETFGWSRNRNKVSAPAPGSR